MVDDVQHPERLPGPVVRWVAVRFELATGVTHDDPAGLFPDRFDSEVVVDTAVTERQHRAIVPPGQVVALVRRPGRLRQIEMVRRQERRKGRGTGDGNRQWNGGTVHPAD